MLQLPAYGVWLANIGGWLVIQLGLSYLFARMPAHWFQRPDVVSPSEVAFYERTLRIRLWKDKLPDGGGLFKGGFPKKRLLSRKPEYLRTFAAETKRGEWNHWCAMVPAPLFFIWNEALAGLIIMLYAFGANAPFVAVLRYNRYRLQLMLRSIAE
ncbi:glycosyl-4,4'-diaponeurosporenoate acyltransferase [Paenibacillus sp. PL2-23]|uniref:glycosyl-4,4'-diaponeurosporenoate acyltransferase CrtO family protein n=1 Tax=Paenibacillus sp. PL2-23 TaxID=2100729 RepID=UPI0030F4D2DD